MPQILYAAEQSVLEFKYILPFITSDDVYKKSFSAQEVADSEIPDIMEKIVYEWERRDYAFEIAVRMYVIRIAVWLLRSWQAVHGFNTPGVTPEVLGAIQKSVEYVQKNYPAATSREAADLCAMSHSYFSRIFKRAMRRSFVDYVNYVRISEAQRMLVGNAKKCNGRCARCGIFLVKLLYREIQKTGSYDAKTVCAEVWEKSLTKCALWG